MDDEYRWAGVEDPKLMITTSHNPSSRLKQFAKVTFFVVGHYWENLLFSYLMINHNVRYCFVTFSESEKNKIFLGKIMYRM